MAGRFIAVVGSSGVGKDAILNLARPRLEQSPEFYFPTRIITRMNETVGQQHESVSNAEFVRRVRDDRFSLWWCVHDMHFALPDDVFDALRDNRIVVANISRRSVNEAAQKFPDMEVIEIVADPDICRRRLLKRGRESEAEIMVGQLREITREWSAGLTVHTIVNDTALAQAVDAFLALAIRISNLENKAIRRA